MLLIQEVDRLIGRLEALQDRTQPAVARLARRSGNHHPGDRPKLLGTCKPWYRQKTFWVGAVLCATGTGEFIGGGDSPGLAVAHFSEGLGLITLRQAVAGIRERC